MIKERLAEMYSTGFRDGAEHAITILSKWMDDEGIEFWVTGFKNDGVNSLAYITRHKFIDRILNALNSYHDKLIEEK